MRKSQGRTYKQYSGCSEDKEDLGLKPRINEALRVDLSLLQTEQGHELCEIVSFYSHRFY